MFFDEILNIILFFFSCDVTDANAEGASGLMEPIFS